MRHVGHMAGIHFDRPGIGALRHHPLLVRIDRPVRSGHHVPGGLGLPGRIPDFMGERVGGDRHLRDSHEPRLLRRNVRCEVGRELLLDYPPVAVAVRLEGLGRLRHGLLDRRTALTFIESKCSDIDQRGHLRMIAGLGDDGPAVAVAHENHWPVHGVDCGLRVLLILGVGVLGGLRHRHLVPIPLEDASDGFPAGAVGEGSMHQNHVLDRHCCSPFFLSVPFTCISSCKPTSFVRHKARYSGSGWSSGRFLSCNIHSLMYGEQCRIETPADSHMLRKRTASISTRSTSPRSKATRGPPRPTSAFTWPTFSDRSCPLKQMRVSRFPAIRLIFSVMEPCPEERSNECNQQAIRDSLQGWKLESYAVLNFQEFLSDEKSAIGLTGLRSGSVSLRGFESILVNFQTFNLRVERPCWQAQFSCRTCRP